MNIIIPKASVTASFKEEGDLLVQELIKKENKEITIDQVEFSVHYAVQVKSSTPNPPAKNDKTAFDPNDYVLGRLTANFGKKSVSCAITGTKATVVVALIKEEWKKNKVLAKKEAERFNGLSKVEQETETQAELDKIKMKKNKGFGGFKGRKA